MSVPNYNKYSHYYERLWIHILKTHKKPLTWYNSLNKSKEHNSFINKKRIRNPPKSNPSKNTPNYPSIASHPLITSINHITSYTHFFQEPPPPLQYMSNHKLYKILSILQSKPMYFYPKPFKFETHQNISSLHNHVSKSHSKITIQILSEYVSNQLDINHKNWKSDAKNKKSQFHSFNVLLTEHIHPIIKKLHLSHLLHQSTKYLPSPLNKTIQPKLVYKTSKSTSHYLFNFTQSINNMSNNINCICTKPQFSPYTREHGHIDTLDHTIIFNFEASVNTHTKLFYILQKGTKFIEIPKCNFKSILNILKNSIKKFKFNLLKTHSFIKKNSLKIWEQNLLRTITQQLETIELPNSEPPVLTQTPIKQLVNQLHQHLIINLADKLPNNYSYCCKTWWLSTLRTSTQNNSSYTHIHRKSPEEIITRQIQYLNSHNFNTPSKKLPTKRLLSKYHKPTAATRPLVAAAMVTTSPLDQLLTVALTALINLLKTQASLFQKINGYTWFLDVEQPQEIVEFLESININPHHSPTIIKTADADGFYDSIQHFWLTKIYRKEIPILFKQSNASFLQINTQHKSYKWIQQWRKQTPTIHILSPKKLIKYLTWSLRNQYILVGNQLYKQVIGVGQGLSHSGHQSRFASIISERNFILSQKSKNPTLAKTYSNI